MNVYWNNITVYARFYPIGYFKILYWTFSRILVLKVLQIVRYQVRSFSFQKNCIIVSNLNGIIITIKTDYFQNTQYFV